MHGPLFLFNFPRRRKIGRPHVCGMFYGRIRRQQRRHDDIVIQDKEAKDTEQGQKGFAARNVRRVKVKGQFGSDTIVPDTILIFYNL
jgi:hypothetical protein